MSLKKDKKYIRARTQFQKQKARTKVLRTGKLTFVVGVLPVLADFIEDLDIEGENSAFHEVYKAIRELDVKIMQPKDPNDPTSVDHFQGAIDSQMIMQRRFREFFKELTNE